MIISLHFIVKKEAVKLLHGNSSSKPHSDPRETHHLSSDFASMFSVVTDLLDKSVDMAKLKDFLDCYSHPLYPEQLYVHPKIYKDANTTKQLIKSLFPQFINFIHYYLLEDIVGKFGCDKAKEDESNIHIQINKYYVYSHQHQFALQRIVKVHVLTQST